MKYLRYDGGDDQRIVPIRVSSTLKGVPHCQSGDADEMSLEMEFHQTGFML